MAGTRTNELGQPIGPPVPDWHPPPRPTRTPIDGPWVRLEPLDADRHAAALFEANALDTEGRNWTYLPVGPFAALDEYTGWLKRMQAGDDPLFFTILDRATSRPVGVASYLRIDPAMGAIEVGHINFSPLAQRSRVATDAIYQMMRHAFALGYRRHEWKCDALNAPSRVAAERFGFSYEGLFRQAVIYKGRNRDTAWYSIIDREFPAIDRAFTRWLDAGNFDAEGRQRARLADLMADERSRQVG